MKRIRTINPLTTLTVMMMIVLGFSAVSVGLTNLSSFDTRNLLTKANDTITNTRDILQSGNRTNALIAEVRNAAADIAQNFTQAEMSRQNQTRVFLPALQNSFVNVERIVNISDDLNALFPRLEDSVNSVTNATSFLAENFGPDTGYIERENFQYKQSNRTAHFINETLPLLLENQEQIKMLLRGLNNTLS